MLRYAFFVFAAYLLLVASQTALAATHHYPSRLWKIESPNKAHIPPSYLLGTMHLPDKEITELPQHIKAIVNQVSSLTLEVKFNAEAQKAFLKITSLRGVKTLSDLIGLDQFQQVVAELKSRGFPVSMIQRLKPWAVALMLSYPPPSKEPVLDHSLQLIFKNQNKPIYQLETAEEQMQIFDGLTVKEQIVFLHHTLTQLPTFNTYLKQMKSFYLAGDLDGLHRLADLQMSDFNETFLQQLFHELIVERNIKMVNRMRFQLRSGNSLIAVGALHLTGVKGIIQLLRHQGYRVTPVMAPGLP